jgi:diacylglycerol kinase family enzyme
MAYNIDDIIFIINPHSGKRMPGKIVNRIRKVNRDFNIFLSESIEKFYKFMNDNVDNYKYFIVVGGDGAVNRTASFLFSREDKILAVVPIGSGNGFARETGFGGDINYLISTIEKGEFIKADCMEIDGKKFINVAGIGFDAFVAHSFAKRNNRGFLNYGIATLQSIFKFNAMNVKIMLNDMTIEGRYNMISMANTRQFGNNAYIAPQAHIESRKLDLVLVKPFPFFYYPIFIINVFAGKVKQSKYVDYIRVDQDFVLETDNSMSHIDGEPIFIRNKTEVKIHKGAINILKMKE